MIIKIAEVRNYDEYLVQNQTYALYEVPQGSPIRVVMLKGSLFEPKIGTPFFVSYETALRDVKYNNNGIIGRHTLLNGMFALFLPSFAAEIDISGKGDLSEFDEMDAEGHILIITYGNKTLYAGCDTVYIMDKNGNTIDKY